MVAHDHRFAFPPAHRLSPSGQKIPFHRQLADLGVKVADLRFMVPAGAVGAVRKHSAQTLNRLALPRAHLVRMHLVLGRDLLDRPVAPQRLQRHSGLEIRREPAPCRHLVSLRYPAEYTLASCPIFWDQLTVPRC